MVVWDGGVVGGITRDPETNGEFAPENRQSFSYSKHPFSGAFAVSFRECIFEKFWKISTSARWCFQIFLYFHPYLGN